MPQSEYSCKSVRHLDLQYADRWYSIQRYATLSRSLLGIQCKVLSIAVKNCENVIDLINMMSNLRVLSAIYEDDSLDIDKHDEDSTIKDELLEWLQLHFPATCIIARDDDIVVKFLFVLSYSESLYSQLFLTKIILSR
jgi:hypothetical protein